TQLLHDQLTNCAAEVAFIDEGVPFIDELIAGLRPEVEPVILNSAKNAVAQIADALSGRTGLAAIHVIAHGRPGEVLCSSGPLSRANIIDHAHDLARIGQALASDGTLALWSCETGHAESGQFFVRMLAEVVGASVGASSELIGNIRLGGHWTLDTLPYHPLPVPPLAHESVTQYAGLMSAPNDIITTSTTDPNSNVIISIETNSGLNVTISGSNDLISVDSTSSNDTLTISGNNDSVTINSNNDVVTLSGTNDKLTFTSSNASLSLTASNDTV